MQRSRRVRLPCHQKALPRLAARIACELRLRLGTPGVGRRLLLEIGISLVLVDSGFRPADDLEERPFAVRQDILHRRRQDLFGHGGWKPYIGAEDSADAQEAAGGDSNDGELVLVERDGFAHDIYRAVEADFPGVVAENGNGSAAGNGDLRRQKESTFDWREAESLEVARGYKLAEEAL